MVKIMVSCLIFDFKLKMVARCVCHGNYQPLDMNVRLRLRFRLKPILRPRLIFRLRLILTQQLFALSEEYTASCYFITIKRRK